ncbi:MAG: M48 family metallopeptidase [Sphingomonadaceae bacterium]|nr:M48 family metallopeptidase [Sphingomonadaceae bacterium]
MTKGVYFLLLCIAGFSSLETCAYALDPALPPPFEGVYQPVGVDEIGHWREDDERERALAASPLVINDEALNSYVNDVLCRTVGQDRCSSVRIYIIRKPIFNATMSYNGTMRVFSGLLLRVRSEAELATVLGHEFGHFEKRHVLSRFKKTRTGTDILTWASVFAAMAPSRNTRDNYQNLEIAIYGDIFRYNREQEREADRLGIGFLNQSRVRPQAASSVWLNVIGEAEASARARGLRKPNFTGIAFAASHPPEGERAEYLAALADPEGERWGDGKQEYRKMMAPWLPMFLDDQIKLNDFGATEFILENLAEDGWTAPLLFARGELYRLRGAPRDLVHAVDFYGEALVMDNDHPGAHRGMGLSMIKLGRRSEGLAALRRFVELAPTASDADMIRLMLPPGE